MEMLSNYWDVVLFVVDGILFFNYHSVGVVGLHWRKKGGDDVIEEEVLVYDYFVNIHKIDLCYSRDLPCINSEVLVHFYHALSSLTSFK